MEEKNKELKVTFRQKKETSCPICNTGFLREELLTGRGRLIAGDITEELRRIYETSQKYGRIYPLIYAVVVCPRCFYASYPDDFDLPIRNMKEKLAQATPDRVNQIRKIFPMIDFTQDRNLEHGLASYILAVQSYESFDKKYAPTFKKALSSIRASWTASDLFTENEDPRWKKLKEFFYNKAAQYYWQSLNFAQSGQEIIDGIKHYGPDLDKNFGYEGMVYMASFLYSTMASLEMNPEKRIQNLAKSKQIISRLFGSGKSSREKPTVILDKIRDLYQHLNQQLKEQSNTSMENA